MHGSHRWSGVVVALFALVLPFKAGGCSRTACITVDPGELGAGRTCPSAKVAQSRVGQPACGAAVGMVEGPGVLDGDLCCYSVSSVSDGPSISNDCFGDVGGGFPGGPVGHVSVGVGGFGGGISDGGFGGGGGCEPCSALINGATGPLCVSAGPAIMDLTSCACSSGCAGVCQELCSEITIGIECADCLKSMATCVEQLMNCEAN